jgi:hypothetical protein
MEKQKNVEQNTPLETINKLSNNDINHTTAQKLPKS